MSGETRTCSVDGCDRAHEAKGYCRAHYKRWRKHGDPTVGKRGRPIGAVGSHRAERVPERTGLPQPVPSCTG